MPYTVSLEDAIRILSALPEYQFFLNDTAPWWPVSKVAEGLGIGDHIVRQWCENQDIIGAVKYPGASGWRIPRSSLLQFLAERSQGSQQGQRQA